MYSKLTKLLNSNAPGKVRLNDRDLVFAYEGNFDGFPLTVKVIRVSGQKKNFIIEHKGENVIVHNEAMAVKYLRGVFHPETLKAAPRHVEMKSTDPAEMALQMNKQVLDSFSLVFEDADETPLNNIEQVGYLDPDMPDIRALEELAEDMTPEVSSNWHSGCINNALKELGLQNRYKLIYVYNGYFCYDKEENKVITLGELYKKLPMAIVKKYDLIPVDKTNSQEDMQSEE